MESHQFWALFVIALIAGAAIALAVNNATMTGAFLEVFRRPRPEPERPRPRPPDPDLKPLVVPPCEGCVCVPRIVTRLLSVGKDKCIEECMRGGYSREWCEWICERLERRDLPEWQLPRVGWEPIK